MFFKLVTARLQHCEVAVELVRQKVKLEELPDRQQLVAATVDQGQRVVVRDLLVDVVWVKDGYPAKRLL